MWKCLKCGEESEDNFDVCWNCQTGKDGSAPPPRNEVISNDESPIGFDPLMPILSFNASNLLEQTREREVRMDEREAIPNAQGESSMKKNVSPQLSPSERPIMVKPTHTTKTQQTIEKWKEKGNIRLLVRCLKDPPEYMYGAREAAVEALCELKDPAAIKPLFDVLNGGILVDSDCGYAIGDVLKAYEDSNLGLEVINILNGKGTPAARAAQALGRMGEVRAVEPLVNKFSDQSTMQWMSRRDSAIALGVLGDKRAVEGLIWALRNDRFDEVRAEAALALGLLGDDAAVAPLAESVSHKNKAVRAAVAHGLGELKNPATVELLLGLMKDKEWEVRAATTDALGKISDQRATQPLKEALQDVIAVQRGAVKALEALGQLRSCWPILNEAEAIVGEPVEAAGLFERVVKLKFGGMLMEIPLGFLFTLGFLLPAMLLAAILGAVVGLFLIVVALGGGFALAHHLMTKRKARQEGISIDLALH